MNRCLTALLALLLSSCVMSSTTTLRPAIERPVIGPVGTIYDALNTARSANPARIRAVFSTRFVHEAVLPAQTRYEPRNADAYFTERDAQLRELEPFAAQVNALCRGYGRLLSELADGCFIEVGEVKYDIRFRNEFRAWQGPNQATLLARFHPKEARADAQGKPTEIKEVVFKFVQENEYWLIDGIEPDPLEGAFVR